jgi:hypothetical protein
VEFVGEFLFEVGDVHLRWYELSGRGVRMREEGSIMVI